MRELETVLRDGRLGAWGDDRLLDRFAEGGDGRSDWAFAALVERHGPRVYRVCRAVTGNGHAAEDAFQATFLVLARKAGTLQVGESLVPWLHRVAARLAASARTAEAKRKRHEAMASHPGEPTMCEPERDHDLSQLLLPEIGLPPGPYRDAVYLCDVESLDMQAAAGRLACSIGTVKSRLSRGRKRLRSRLLKRGIAPAALATSTVATTSAAPPRVLVEATVRGAMAITAGGAASGMIPAAAVALFEEGMTTMLWTKLRGMIGTVLVGMTAAAAVVVAQDAPSADARPVATDSATATRTTQRATPKPSDPIQSPDRRGSRSETIRSTRPSADTPTQSLDSPSDAEVLEALFKKKYSGMTVRLEKVNEDSRSVSVGGIEGAFEHVQVQYKATVSYRDREGEGDRRKSHIDEVFIDKSYLRHAGDGERATRQSLLDDANRAIAGNPSRSFSAPPAGHQVSAKATERQLDEVERKLDRILKALEKGGPETRSERLGDPMPLDTDLGDPVNGKAHPDDVRRPDLDEAPLPTEG